MESVESRPTDIGNRDGEGEKVAISDEQEKNATDSRGNSGNKTETSKKSKRRKNPRNSENRIALPDEKNSAGIQPIGGFDPVPRREIKDYRDFVSQNIQPRHYTMYFQLLAKISPDANGFKIQQEILRYLVELRHFKHQDDSILISYLNQIGIRKEKQDSYLDRLADAEIAIGNMILSLKDMESRWESKGN